MINEQILKSEERIAYTLRSLYRSFGYSQYKMSKFEEYDLYGRNKAFLVSDEIITFTDARGKLMALKPDVTLSIVKNSKDVPGFVQKTCYNESVYRFSGSTGEFKEIMQTGLECIGDIGLYHICEVLTLAAKSLMHIHDNCLMDISHAGLVAALLNGLDLEEGLRDRILECVRAKNPDGAANLPGISEEAAKLARVLSADYGDYASAAIALRDYSSLPAVQEAMREFGEIYSALERLGFADMIKIDFSIANDMRYYSGVVFKGYVKGLPTSVLSGGQYDKLMQKMGRRSGAIGFAVYLDVLERFNQSGNAYDSDIVLLSRPGDDPAELIKAVERLSAGGESVAVLSVIPDNYIYKRAYSLKGKELAIENGNG